MTLFGGAQTYIGVLATFIVLCLFNHKEKENGGNFLFSTFIKIGEDIVKILTNHVLELKQEINSIYENKEEHKEEKVSELRKKANQDDGKRLLQNRNATRMQENKFFSEATTIKNQFNPTEQLKQKEELTYIALFSLIIIIICMLVDCVEIVPISVKSTFINLLISTSIVYSFVLYRKFFWKVNEAEYLTSNLKDKINSDRFKKPIKYKMLLKVSFSFFFWLFLILFINSAWVSIILLPLSLGMGLYFTKIKWLNLFNKYDKYDRIFILKHSVYIVSFAILCTGLIYLILSSNYIYKHFENWGFTELMNDWNSSIILLQNHLLAKHIAIIFFTLNGIFLPLLFGYIYLIINEHEIIKKINNLQIQYKSKVVEYEEEFKAIERKIDSTVFSDNN